LKDKAIQANIEAPCSKLQGMRSFLDSTQIFAEIPFEKKCQFSGFAAPIMVFS
jgi:hypothetical protein